jgi:hypothetical protein
MPATPPTPVAPPRLETAAEIVEKLHPDDIEALAALRGAPTGVAELAFSAFPSGTRDWLVTYGLAVGQADGTLAVTDLGREAIEQAATQCPEPYGDLSLEDLRASTRKALEVLVNESGVRIREPGTHAVDALPVATSPRTRGQDVGRLIQRSLASWHERIAERRRKQAEHSDDQHLPA